MLTRRILPCLNVIDGRVKKRLLGSERLLDVGDPVELAFKYQENGTDGLAFITDPSRPAVARNYWIWSRPFPNRSLCR